MTDAQTEARAIVSAILVDERLAVGYQIETLADAIVEHIATALAAKDAELARQIEVRDDAIDDLQQKWWFQSDRADRAEALSRTGAVKVDRQRLNMEISKWATDRDLHITIGDVEALHLSILSALEPAAQEGFCYRDENGQVQFQQTAPEGQQEAAEADRIRREMEEILRRQSERDIPFAPATRPAEQAVTEAARRVLEWVYPIAGDNSDEVAAKEEIDSVEALKAAMEAGRHD